MAICMHTRSVSGIWVCVCVDRRIVIPHEWWNYGRMFTATVRTRIELSKFFFRYFFSSQLCGSRAKRFNKNKLAEYHLIRCFVSFRWMENTAAIGLKREFQSAERNICISDGCADCWWQWLRVECHRMASLACWRENESRIISFLQLLLPASRRIEISPR